MGGSQADAAAMTEVSQFQVLAARPCLGQLYDESDRPMVKEVIRLENQRAEGAVLPVADPYRDISCCSIGGSHMQARAARYVWRDIASTTVL